MKKAGEVTVIITGCSEEICGNGIDDDCDNLIDEDCTATTYYKDNDKDGYGDPANSISATTPPAGYIIDHNDCDDNDAAVHPGATEICDGKDNDCNGAIDDGMEDQKIYFRDKDGDGYGTNDDTKTGCTPPAGYATEGGDCNDDYAEIHPGAKEVCNGTDDNCNGVADEGLITGTYFKDEDKDGYGNPSNSITACSQPDGYVNNNTDCDDTDPAVHPGADEVCDGKDNNCNGQVDEGVTTTFYYDADGDGFGNASVTKQGCTKPDSYVTDKTDCDDNNASIHPDAIEICDSNDNDCNGKIDDGVMITYYQDTDGDSYGNPTESVQACSQPIGYVTNKGDCNDSDAAIHPNAPELCDGKDNDCNGLIDDHVTMVIFYRDKDGDGYGDENQSKLACNAPSGYVSKNGDCDDNNATIFPGAVELCDGKDNNCNGQIDEKLITAFYRDQDQDGYSDNDKMIQDCKPKKGYVTVGGDCDDKDAKVHPGAVEICGNGIDDNCNGEVDEGCRLPVITINNVQVYESERVAMLTVSLSKASAVPVRMHFETIEGTAVSPKDYKEAKGNITIRPGALAGYISIDIASDKITESDEYFKVRLSNATNAVISNGIGVITIIDGEVPVTKANIATSVDKQKEAIQKLIVNAVPNPTARYFTIYVQSNRNTPVTLRITDAVGRVVETKTGMLVNSSISIAHNYISGIYYLEAIQGSQKVTLKLIKQSY